MLFECMKAEKRKLRHSIIWVAPLFIPVIPSVMGAFNYLQNLSILTGEWYSLWTQYTLFYADFFYAPLIALYCSYLWRMEHVNHNWNLLMTMPVSPVHIFLGKLWAICKVTVITQLWMFLLFVVGGRLIGLSGWPSGEILLWALRGTLASLAIGSLQLLLSMCIRGFAVPIGIALAGSVAGLLLSNSGKGLYFPYSLMLMGMNSSSYEDKLAGSVYPFLASTLFFSLLFCTLGILLLRQRDIRA
nr:ABC transporter permease [uncultured Acetatifactor sp.]